MRYFIFLSVLLSFGWASAAANPALIKSLGANYLIQKQLQSFSKSRSSVSINGVTVAGGNSNCPPPVTSNPNIKSCIDSVCSHLSPFDCDDASEIQAVAGVCKGNIDGDCVNSYCAKLGKFGCDDFSEVAQVAGLCKGLSSGDCSTTVCNHLGKFGCDDMSEIQSVAGVCTPNLDPDCLDTVCAKLGKFDCDDISEITSVAKSCSVF
jgi:hypothetical protein